MPYLSTFTGPIASLTYTFAPPGLVTPRFTLWSISAWLKLSPHLQEHENPALKRANTDSTRSAPTQHKMGTEKDVHDGVSTPETTQINTDSRHGAGTEHVVGGGTSGRDENFYTRNGLNMESFKRREHGRITDTQLDRTMKSRHLHMIAIGMPSCYLSLIR